jgi:DNA-binding NarL/FixJ family response regulator
VRVAMVLHSAGYHSVSEGAAPMSPAIRLLLADDQPIVREALERLLAATSGIRVLTTGVGDGWQAIEACAGERPDVLLLDLAMPGPEPPDVVAAVRRASPRTRILVLSGRDDDTWVGTMCAAGVAGYVLKT